MNEEILEAKRRLYLLLLKKPKLDSRGLTDNEIELLLRLSIDEQIQKLFEEKD
jgi:hypothetical protein